MTKRKLPTISLGEQGVSQGALARLSGIVLARVSHLNLFVLLNQGHRLGGPPTQRPRFFTTYLVTVFINLLGEPTKGWRNLNLVFKYSSSALGRNADS